MRSNLFSTYKSERVENLAVRLLQELSKQNGISSPSDEEARFILERYDLKSAGKKLPKFAALKHKGQYGRVDRDLQQQLNLKLFIQDTLDLSQQNRFTLVDQIVSENDDYIQKKRSLQFNQEMIANLLEAYRSPSNHFERLLRKTDNLLTIQKSYLRSAIRDDSKYEQALDGLTAIYQQHLKRAIGLQEKKVVTDKGKNDSLTNGPKQTALKRSHLGKGSKVLVILLALTHANEIYLFVRTILIIMLFEAVKALIHVIRRENGFLETNG